MKMTEFFIRRALKVENYDGKSIKDDVLRYEHNLSFEDLEINGGKGDRVHFGFDNFFIDFSEKEWATFVKKILCTLEEDEWKLVLKKR